MNSNNTTNETREYSPVEWDVVKVFKSGNIVVQISQSKTFKPRFSYQVGRENDQGKIVSHIGLFIHYKLTDVEIRDSYAAIISSLVSEAEQWIGFAARDAHEKNLAKMLEKEEDTERRNRPKQKPGLKKLSKMDVAIREIINTENKPVEEDPIDNKK